MIRYAVLLLALACSSEPDGDQNGDSGSKADVDADGDGAKASVDCDDGDSARFPGATEVCDGLDNDCDGLADDADTEVEGTSNWFGDADGDTYGDPGSMVVACAAPTGFVADYTDCADQDGARHPGQSESCDGVDNDCDQMVDDADTVDDYSAGVVGYEDVDQDTYGAAISATSFCVLPGGMVETSGDCDDLDAAVNPLASEVCDTIDNDCDGLTDDADLDNLDASAGLVWYTDADVDGYGANGGANLSCVIPANGASAEGDCVDSDAAIHPDADEACNSVDDDCDTLIDDADTVDDYSLGVTLYQDNDNDGYGNTDVSTVACAAAAGWLVDSTDCDDTDGTIYPLAAEVCDDVDADCDAATDGCDGECATTEATYSFDCDGACAAVDGAGGPDCDAVCDSGDDASGADCLGAPVVAVTPSVPGTGEDLVATADLAGVTWEWTRDGVAVAEVSGLDTVPSALTTRGEVWVARGTAGGLTGLGSVTVANTPPTLSVTLAPTEPGTDDELSVTLTGADADGDGVSYAYEWSVNGVVIAETGATLDGTLWFDAGDTVEVTVTPFDGYDYGTPATSSVSVSGCGVLSFDGSGDYVTVPASTDFTYGAAYTTEAWGYTTGTGNYTRLTDHDGNLSYGWRFQWQPGGNISLKLRDGSSGQATGAFSSGAWHHVAGVYTASTVSLYIDGVLAASGAASALSSGTAISNLYIGSANGGSQSWTGKIGPTRVSSVARYSSSFTPEWGWTADSDTLGLWNFEDGSGSTLADSSGGGHDGAITGATWAAVECP